MALFDSISNKLLNTKMGKKWAENSERQRILEIIENGSKDELNELGIQIHKNIKENPTNFALKLFAEVFVWTPTIIRAIYGIEETTNLCSEFQKQIEPLIERASKRCDNWSQFRENLDFLGNDDLIIYKTSIFYLDRCNLLYGLYFLFDSKESCNEKIWVIVEKRYGEDSAKDLREEHSSEIELLVNQTKIFNEFGALDNKISFSYLENMVAYYELGLKFDKELATKYLQTVTKIKK